MDRRVPHTQQFSPGQTPLEQLLPILRQNSSDCDRLRSAVASAFFKTKADPKKIAGNTIIALRFHGVIDAQCALTDFGKQLVAFQGSEDKAHRLLAKHILLDLNGIAIVEALREMKRGGMGTALTTLPDELRQRGITASPNSSDLSDLLNWLREANVLTGYDVNEAEYAALLGTEPEALDVMKGLSGEQVAFLRAMLALNVRDWSSYSEICKHAEGLYPGEVRYNWKEIVSAVLKPMVDVGLIELRKRAKKATGAPEGRRGKPADVRPAAKFEAQIAEPLLGALYRSAGFAEIRQIRSMSLNEIVADIEQTVDKNKSAKALELLAIRLCQMLDLEFMGWRETDVPLTAAGQVGAFLRALRPPFTRWQLLCTVRPVTIEAIANEVGIRQATFANVILIVSTGNVTANARRYWQKASTATDVDILIIDRPALERVVRDLSALQSLLSEHFSNAIRSTLAWRPWSLARQPDNITTQSV